MVSESVEQSSGHFESFQLRNLTNGPDSNGPSNRRRPARHWRRPAQAGRPTTGGRALDLRGPPTWDSSPSSAHWSASEAERRPDGPARWGPTTSDDRPATILSPTGGRRSPAPANCCQLERTSLGGPDGAARRGQRISSSREGGSAGEEEEDKERRKDLAALAAAKSTAGPSSGAEDDQLQWAELDSFRRFQRRAIKRQAQVDDLKQRSAPAPTTRNLFTPFLLLLLASGTCCLVSAGSRWGQPAAEPPPPLASSPAGPQTGGRFEQQQAQQAAESVPYETCE